MNANKSEELSTDTYFHFIARLLTSITIPAIIGYSYAYSYKAGWYSAAGISELTFGWPTDLLLHHAARDGKGIVAALWLIALAIYYYEFIRMMCRDFLTAFRQFRKVFRSGGRRRYRLRKEAALYLWNLRSEAPLSRENCREALEKWKELRAAHRKAAWISFRKHYASATPPQNLLGFAGAIDERKRSNKYLARQTQMFFISLLAIAGFFLSWKLFLQDPMKAGRDSFCDLAHEVYFMSQNCSLDKAREEKIQGRKIEERSTFASSPGRRFGLNCVGIKSGDEPIYRWLIEEQGNKLLVIGTGGPEVLTFGDAKFSWAIEEEFKCYAISEAPLPSDSADVEEKASTVDGHDSHERKGR